MITKTNISSLPLVKHPSPPNFVNLNSGRHVVYPGGGWYLVADDVTREDIESRWERWEPSNEPKIDGSKEWKVEGSKGKTYTVSIIAGSYSCTCPGFGFRKRCKHIEQIKANV